MVCLIYESPTTRYELSNEHPASSHGLGVLLVRRKCDGALQEFDHNETSVKVCGPAEKLAHGITAGQLVKSFISNPPVAPPGYANFGKYTEEAGELARKFLSQLPEEVPVEADALIENHSTIFMVRVQTEKAKAWLKAHVDPDSQWFGEALAVEHGYVRQLVDGMQEAGLVVR